MPSYSSTAAKVRKHKAEHPELYCAAPSCLWRTGGPRGTPCQKHPTVGAFLDPRVQYEAERAQRFAEERERFIRECVNPDAPPFPSLRELFPERAASLDADDLAIAHARQAVRDFPLEPITARPVDLNPEAWGEEGKE